MIDDLDSTVDLSANRKSWSFFVVNEDLRCSFSTRKPFGFDVLTAEDTPRLRTLLKVRQPFETVALHNVLWLMSKISIRQKHLVDSLKKVSQRWQSRRRGNGESARDASDSFYCCGGWQLRDGNSDVADKSQCQCRQLRRHNGDRPTILIRYKSVNADEALSKSAVPANKCFAGASVTLRLLDVAAY